MKLDIAYLAEYCWCPE